MMEIICLEWKKITKDMLDKVKAIIEEEKLNTGDQEIYNFDIKSILNLYSTSKRVRTIIDGIKTKSLLSCSNCSQKAVCLHNKNCENNLFMEIVKNLGG